MEIVAEGEIIIRKIESVTITKISVVIFNTSSIIAEL